MQRSANQHRRDMQLDVGDLVYIATSNLRVHPSVNRKLAPRWVGPYKIVQKISQVAFRIALPPDFCQVHPVFHISQLKLHVGADPVRRTPITVADSTKPEYEVERVVAKRLNKNRVEYLV